MRLVPDWRECWRWNSTHGMGVAFAIITAWNYMPQKFQDAFPPHVVLGLASISLVLGFVGRLRDQSLPKIKPTVPENKPC